MRLQPQVAVLRDSLAVLVHEAAESRHIHMNTQYGVLFKALDEYVRAQHHCFVAECFLNPHSHNEWVICVRPREDNARVLDKQSSRATASISAYR
jgi:hypothetical protein